MSVWATIDGRLVELVGFGQEDRMRSLARDIALGPLGFPIAVDLPRFAYEVF
jgi:hypothetical protein